MVRISIVTHNHDIDDQILAEQWQDYILSNSTDRKEKILNAFEELFNSSLKPNFKTGILSKNIEEKIYQPLVESIFLVRPFQAVQD